MNDSERIIGIDLGKDYSQLSYYDMEKMDYRSLIYAGQALIPTVLYNDQEDGAWKIGKDSFPEENNINGREKYIHFLDGYIDREERTGLIKVFLTKLIAEIDPLHPVRPSYLTVTVTDLDEEMVQIIGDAAEQIVGDKGTYNVQSHTLSYEYYALSQKLELWTKDVGLFEYDRRGLRYTHLGISASKRPARLNAQTEDLTMFLDGKSMEADDIAAKDQSFAEAVKHVSAGRSIATFYLTGPGFELDGDGGSWMSKSLRELCSLRRHVFAGQNIFSRGACYSSFYDAYPVNKPSFITSDTELTVCDIYMVASKANKNMSIELVSAQKIWRASNGSACIILEDGNEFAVYARNVITGQICEYVMELDNIPDRPRGTLRLNVKVSYTSRDVCHVHVQDTGFGELYPSSGQSWDGEFSPLKETEEFRKNLKGIVLCAAPCGQPGLEIELSGQQVYSTDELSYCIFDNVYVLSEKFFSDRLYVWLDARCGNRKLSSALKALKGAGKPLSDLARNMLTDFGYLGSQQISMVCSSIEQIGRKNAFEQAKIKADSMCRYGSYTSALKLYHHASYLAQKGEVTVSREQEGQTLHNMAVCLMYLHDTQSAADCMLKAYRLSGKRQMMMEYLCILRMGEKMDQLHRFAAQEKLGQELMEQSVIMCSSVSRVYNESERYLGLKAGLALKKVPDSPVYSEFVNGYISTQCRRYGLNTYRKDGD